MDTMICSKCKGIEQLDYLLCTKCKVMKHVNEFFRCKNFKRQRSYRCKECDVAIKSKPINCNVCNTVVPQCNWWQHSRTMKHQLNSKTNKANCEINSNDINEKKSVRLE